MATVKYLNNICYIILMVGEDISSKSGYNEASYKMIRIDASQKRIAAVNHNLLGWYGDIGDYGYKIKKVELENLKSEVWGKLGDDAKERCNQLIEILDNSLEKKPIHELVKINGVEGQKKTARVNSENFKYFKKWLDILQEYINELLEDAGYSTFTVDTYDDDPYN